MNGARAADADAAPVLGAGETQAIAQRPQQRHRRIAVDPTALTVDVDRIWRHVVDRPRAIQLMSLEHQRSRTMATQTSSCPMKRIDRETRRRSISDTRGSA